MHAASDATKSSLRTGLVRILVCMVPIGMPLIPAGCGGDPPSGGAATNGPVPSGSAVPPVVPTPPAAPAPAVPSAVPRIPAASTPTASSSVATAAAAPAAPAPAATTTSTAGTTGTAAVPAPSQSAPSVKISANLAPGELSETPVVIPANQDLMLTRTLSPFLAVGYTTSGKGTCEVWNLQDMQKVGVPLSGLPPANAFALSPDGKHFACVISTQSTPTVSVWSVDTGAELRKIVINPSPITVEILLFAGPGRLVTAKQTTKGKLLQVWDVASGDAVKEFAGPQNFEKESVAVRSDGRLLAIFNDKHVLVYDLTTGHKLVDLDSAAPHCRGLCFTPDGTELAGLFFDNRHTKVLSWTTADLKQVVSHALVGDYKHVLKGAFSYKGPAIDVLPDGSAFLLYGHGIVDRATGRLVWVLQDSPNDFNPVPRRLVDNDHVTIAAGSSQGERRLAVLKLPWAKIDASLKALAAGADAYIKPGQSVSLLVEVGAVLCAAFAADGKTLASGSEDGGVRLWDMTTQAERATLQGHGLWVYCVAFSPDSKTLASGSADKTVKLWGRASGRALRTLKGHNGTVLSLAFSPDGQSLATGSYDKSVKLWSLATGEPQATLEGHTAAIFSLAFSPDGKTLATASGDKTVKLWDVVSREIRATCAGHTELIWCVAFAPNGATLASASGDGTVRLWNAATGEQRGVIQADTSGVQSVCFSPDGKWLATGGSDRLIKLWNAEAVVSE